MFPTLNRIESSASIEAAPIIAYQSEILFKNQIENELQSVLRPLSLMQALFICSKYKIRDKTITPNSFTYNFIGVTCTLIFVGYSFYSWYSTFFGFRHGLFVLLNWSAIYDNFFFSFGFILNQFSNIKYRYQNVLLVSRIQHALTLLKINSRELRSLKVYNWISVISLNSVFVASWIIFFGYFPEISYTSVFLSYCVIIFDINVMYASFVMKLLSKMLIAWIEDVRRAEHIIITDLERESYWNMKYDVYVNIMEAYKLVEITSCQHIVFNIINTASHGLLHIATILEIKILMFDIVLFSLVIVVSQIWLIKNILVGISMSVNCEKFYTAVDDVEGALIPLMYSDRCSDKHTLSVFKNIQRIKSGSFKKMNVCGMFFVDAMMSLRLFSFITTHTIVLIQFDFL